MSKRTVAILGAALVVLLALVIFGQRGSAPVSSGAALVPDLRDALGDISRVTVVKANGETVATLEKGADSWVVSDKHGYVANAAKLRQALQLALVHVGHLLGRGLGVHQRRGRLGQLHFGREHHAETFNIDAARGPEQGELIVPQGNHLAIEAFFSRGDAGPAHARFRRGNGKRGGQEKAREKAFGHD